MAKKDTAKSASDAAILEAVAPATLSRRNERQKLLVPDDKLVGYRCLVVGVGAVGRQVALQLASIGAAHVMIVDHDTVEDVNIATQGYYVSDIGRHKVEATGDIMQKIHPAGALTTIKGRFERAFMGQLPGDPKAKLAVFACVDSIEVRRLIWEASKAQTAFWADGRMAAEVLQVFTSTNPPEDKDYAKTLFTAAEAYAGSCTAQSTCFTANVVAAFMVQAFSLHLRGLPVLPKVELNLLSMDLIVEDAPAKK